MTSRIFSLFLFYICTGAYNYAINETCNNVLPTNIDGNLSMIYKPAEFSECTNYQYYPLIGRYSYWDSSYGTKCYSNGAIDGARYDTLLLPNDYLLITRQSPGWLPSYDVTLSIWDNSSNLIVNDYNITSLKWSYNIPPRVLSTPNSKNSQFAIFYTYMGGDNNGKIRYWIFDIDSQNQTLVQNGCIDDGYDFEPVLQNMYAANVGWIKQFEVELLSTNNIIIATEGGGCPLGLNIYIAEYDENEGKYPKFRLKKSSTSQYVYNLTMKGNSYIEEPSPNDFSMKCMAKLDATNTDICAITSQISQNPRLQLSILQITASDDGNVLIEELANYPIYNRSSSGGFEFSARVIPMEDLQSFFIAGTTEWSDTYYWIVDINGNLLMEKYWNYWPKEEVSGTIQHRYIIYNEDEAIIQVFIMLGGNEGLVMITYDLDLNELNRDILYFDNDLEDRDSPHITTMAVHQVNDGSNDLIRINQNFTGQDWPYNAEFTVNRFTLFDDGCCSDLSNINGEFVPYTLVVQNCYDDEMVSDGSLSGGEIAGIVIGVVVFIILVILGCLYVKKQRNKQRYEIPTNQQPEMTTS